MPFENRAMSEQRAEFVRLATQPGANRRARCRHFGIAPATAYKWLRRFAAKGPAGLEDRSRRPHRSPTRMSPAIEQAVLRLRAQHPTWGTRKHPAWWANSTSHPEARSGWLAAGWKTVDVDLGGERLLFVRQQ